MAFINLPFSWLCWKFSALEDGHNTRSNLHWSHCMDLVLDSFLLALSCGQCVELRRTSPLSGSVMNVFFSHIIPNKWQKLEYATGACRGSQRIHEFLFEYSWRCCYAFLRTTFHHRLVQIMVQSDPYAVCFHRFLTAQLKVCSLMLE